MKWYGHAEPEAFATIDDCITDCEISFIDAGYERCEIVDALEAYRRFLADGRQGPPFCFEMQMPQGPNHLDADAIALMED